jgi:hypothetical protein
MRASFCVGLMLAVAVCAGCGTMKGSQAYQNYKAEMDQTYPTFGSYLAMTLKDSLMDFTDIFRFHAAGGEGIGLDVQPTEPLQFGFMFTDNARMGWQKRSFGVWNETRREGGVGWAYYRSLEMEPIRGQEAMFDQPKAFKDFTLRHNSEFHWADIGFQTHLVFFGFGFYFSPKETIDFLYGLGNIPIAVLRPGIQAMGLDAAQLDYSEDDSPAAIRRKYGQVWIPQAEGFEPTEMLNDWMELPY